MLMEVGLRTSMAVGRRAYWKGGEMGRQTEKNDEKVVVGMVEPRVVEPRVQLIRAPCSLLRLTTRVR